MPAIAHQAPPIASIMPRSVVYAFNWLNGELRATWLAARVSRY